MSGPAPWDGDSYQRRFDDLSASGVDVHGEAAFVAGLEPSSVLDAGCGSGRVAIELSRRGIPVVGIDRDPSMIATARQRGPGIDFEVADVAEVDLGRTFGLVVMAGNVPLFTPPGTQAALVAGCARHLGVGGLLVAGFQLEDRYPLTAYDADCRAAGLVPDGRWATWSATPFTPDAAYAVSLHRRET